MKPVLENTDTLVFVSGITADRSRPVLRAVDYLRSQGYHELVSHSTVIINHTDQITDKDALAYLTERFTKVGAIVEVMPFDPHLAKGGIIDTVHELKKRHDYGFSKSLPAWPINIFLMPSGRRSDFAA